MEWQQLIAAMDDLLAETPAYTPKSLADYWAGSASQSVIDSYKDGLIIDVGHHPHNQNRSS